MAKPDKYPQWLNLNSITEEVAGTFKESVPTQMPQRISGNQVMEILGIEYEFSGAALSDINADIDQSNLCQITETTQNGVISLNDPDCVDMAKTGITLQAFEGVETGGAGAPRTFIVWHDFASSGKGFLFGGRQMFTGVKQDQTVNKLTCNPRVLYRLVKVTAEELIGIVRQ